MAAFARLGGRDVIAAQVTFPRVGAWTARLRVDGAGHLSGHQAFTLGSGRFSGAVQQATVHNEVCHVHLVGGAAGLRKQLPAKSYRQAPLRVPLNDITREAGETLSSLSDPGVMSTQLRHWMRTAGRAGHLLGVLLAEQPEVAWRFQPDGRLWVGRETWPAARVQAEVTGFDAFSRKVSLFSLSPGVLPGMTYLGRRVDAVEHFISEQQVRTDVWFEVGS